MRSSRPPTKQRSRVLPLSARGLWKIDVEPLYATARLLYEGPWVAERYLTAKDLLARDPESILPVTRQIITAGEKTSAADAFDGLL